MTEHRAVTQFRDRLLAHTPSPSASSLAALAQLNSYLMNDFGYGDRVYIPANPDDKLPPHIGRIVAFRADYSEAYVRYHRGYAKWEKLAQLKKADPEKAD